MCDVYGKACFNKKNVYRWANLFKEDWKCIKDENRSGRHTVLGTPEKVDSVVNALISADIRITIEDISEQLGNPTTTTDLSKVSCCWVLPGQCKVSYCSKKSRSNQSVWLEMLDIDLKFPLACYINCMGGMLEGSWTLETKTGNVLGS